MSRDASILLPFHDGEDYNFRLACGPFVIYLRLFGSEWYAEDIREVIRLGFIGGGMSEVNAKSMVVEYVENRPLIENLSLAQEIMKAAVLGPPDKEDIEKKAAAASGSTTSTMDVSVSPPSTELVQ